MRTFDETHIRFSIPLTDDEMQALMDSESYATGNMAFKPGRYTLCDRLNNETMAREVDYNGHFGAQVVLGLDIDDNTADERNKISAIIDEHLAWCMSLPLADHVRKQREQGE